MMLDLSTQYLGLSLSTPVVVGACPLTGRLEFLAALEECGAGAVVLPSVFQEQLEAAEGRDQAPQYGSARVEAVDDLRGLDDYNGGIDGYLELIESAKKHLRIPVIANLNGITHGPWLDYARRIQDAGADALELNVYFLGTDSAVSGQEVEMRSLDLVAAVRTAVEIPLAVKLGPYFSSMAHIAKSVVEAGADGLVLFNRFLCPDMDLEQFQSLASPPLSSSMDNRLPMRWIALLRQQLGVSLAATSGVHDHEDILKLVCVGADAVMVASALIIRGPEHLGQILEWLRTWLQEHDYQALHAFKSSVALTDLPFDQANERSEYIRTLCFYSTEQPKRV